MTERLFCFYGDDFTGSTDALEALAANGVASVLFLEPPDDRLLGRFVECRAVGIAGESRSRSPEWMSEHLPAVFTRLRALGAPICQYKVCSTFDSSPETGSIGRALEIGLQVFETPWAPVVVAAPHLKRYVVFGNLFAGAGDGNVYRIDRHPTMSRHPVTPMNESDLRLHLSRQTEARTALFNIVQLRDPAYRKRFIGLLARNPQAVIFDGLEECTLRNTGEILWHERPREKYFAIGSSGLTQSLIHYWRSAGMVPESATNAPAAAADQLLVISGSCSLVTAGQIRWAVANGFSGIHAQPCALADEQRRSRLLRECEATLADGRSLVIYSALEPGDYDSALPREELGRSTGVLLRELLERSRVRRIVVAGGDTSSHSVRQLSMHALTFLAELAPGAPLCRGHSENTAMDGREFVLKGGQVGPEDFFGRVLKGQR